MSFLNEVFRDKRLPRQSSESPIVVVARNAKDKLSSSGELARIGGERDLQQELAFTAAQLKNMGIGDPLYESIQRRGAYFRELVSLSLDEMINGGNMAIALGKASQEIAEILNPDLNPRDRVSKAFDVCKIILVEDKKRELGKFSKKYPTVFAPARELLTAIYARKDAVLSNIDGLQVAYEQQKKSLTTAGEHIKKTSSSIMSASNAHDKSLAYAEQITQLNRELSELHMQLTSRIASGQKTEEIARRITEKRAKLEQIPQAAIESNEGVFKLISASGESMNQAIAMGVLTQSSRATAMSLGVHYTAGVAIPLLGAQLCADLVESAAVWSMYATARVYMEMGDRTQLNLSVEQARRQVSGLLAANRARYLDVIGNSKPQE